MVRTKTDFSEESLKFKAVVGSQRCVKIPVLQGILHGLRRGDYIEVEIQYENFIAKIYGDWRFRIPRLIWFSKFERYNVEEGTVIDVKINAKLEPPKTDTVSPTKQLGPILPGSIDAFRIGGNHEKKDLQRTSAS